MAPRNRSGMDYQAKLSPRNFSRYRLLNLLANIPPSSFVPDFLGGVSCFKKDSFNRVFYFLVPWLILLPFFLIFERNKVKASSKNFAGSGSSASSRSHTAAFLLLENFCTDISAFSEKSPTGSAFAK